MEEMNDAPNSQTSKANFGWRRMLPRFSIASMMWMSLVCAICVLWYRDHTRLQRQISRFYSVDTDSWSSSQIIGPADTPIYGDIPTAWASRTPDIQEEWIIVEFPKTVSATQVDIYETFNPGAVTQIYSVSMFGGESLIWEGKDPLANSLPTRQTAISKIQFSSPITTRRIKIVIDSKALPGWNEIDAVELIDQNGKRQWASAAWTSSSFGKNISKPYWFLP